MDAVIPLAVRSLKDNRLAPRGCLVRVTDQNSGAPLRSATACIIWPRNHPVASPAKRGKSTSAGRGHQ